MGGQPLAVDPPVPRASAAPNFYVLKILIIGDTDTINSVKVDI